MKHTPCFAALLGLCSVFVTGCFARAQKTADTSRAPDAVPCHVGATEDPVVRGRDGWSAPVLAGYPGTSLFAEGILEEPRTGRLYISGEQGLFTADAAWRVAALASFPAGRAVKGMALDERGDAIWAVASAGPDDDAHATIVKLARADGSILAEFALPGVDQWYGDIAVGRDGAVYVGNPRSGRLHVLRAGARSVEELLAPGPLRSPQGMIATPDGRRLLIADYASGLATLAPDTRTVVRLESPAGFDLSGIDGIVLSGNDVFALQNGVSPFRILRLQMDGTLSRILRVWVVAEFSTVEPRAALEPTLGASTRRGLLFVARSLADVPRDSRRTVIGSICRMSPGS
jgi:sugar lactone lactonase YvrE